MDNSIHYVCPNCGDDLKTFEESFMLSWLKCNSCLTQTPIVYGFSLFTETLDQKGCISTERIENLKNNFQAKSSQYELYKKNKAARNIFEIYAAMQPFNESTQAFYPFIDSLKNQLKQGDVIIDTWARTGWHALLLAALFPDQKVIAVWDSHTSVLGYAGYGYWFSDENKPENLEIIFSPANKKLPFKTHSIAAIYAHDVIHRYDFPFYTNELLRIAAEKSIVFMPHIHLNDAEPKPYFERGGILRSKMQYEKGIQKILVNTSKKMVMLSEKDLFLNPQNSNLNSTFKTQDYNGFGLIYDDCFKENSYCFSIENHLTKSSRFILNPLLTINPTTREIVLKDSAFNGQTKYYLKRHPTYQEKLNTIVGEKLNQNEIKLLLLCTENRMLNELSITLEWSEQEVRKVIIQLFKNELILPFPVSEMAVELQNFYNNHQRLFPNRFDLYWQEMLEHSNTTNFLTLEGQPLSVLEVNEVIQAIAFFINFKRKAQKFIVIDAMSDVVKQQIIMMAVWWVGESVFTRIENKIVKNPSMTVSKPNVMLVNTQDSDTSYDSFWSIIENNLGKGIDVEMDSFNYLNDEMPWYQQLLEIKK